MKLLNKDNNSIIEITDKARIEKLLGYPDRFEKIEEPKKETKSAKLDEPKENENKKTEIKESKKNK